MSLLCEACELAAVEVEEPCDDTDEPYRVCAACHQRLLARELRPLEWYNLAKRHGWSCYLLHDDFYDDDGTAAQPEGEMDSPEDFPAPTLAAVSHDARLLLDFSVTCWHFEPEIAAAWGAIPRPEVLSVLAEKFRSTKVAGFRSCVLDVCASALGDFGAEFVRRAWELYPAMVDLPSLANASAACLPSEEGFERVASALAQEEDTQKRDLMFSLGYFQTPRVLDWIEQNVFDPISENWGRLAASRLDFTRVEKWLQLGRLLSLVAIDALAAIVRPLTPFLRGLAPRLHEAPPAELIERELSAYCVRDPAPRVQQRTAAVISNVHLLSNRG